MGSEASPAQPPYSINHRNTDHTEYMPNRTQKDVGAVQRFSVFSVVSAPDLELTGHRPAELAETQAGDGQHREIDGSAERDQPAQV